MAAKIICEITVRSNQQHENIRKVTLYSNGLHNYVVMEQELITSLLGPKKWALNNMIENKVFELAHYSFLGLVTKLGMELGNPLSNETEQVAIASSQAYRNAAVGA